MSETPSFAPGDLSMSLGRTSQSPERPAPKRKAKNYLLDKRFQLKYAAMVMGVTLLISTVLGFAAYHYSHGQTEALGIQLALQPDLDPAVQGDLEGWARDQDRKVAAAIIIGVLILVLVIGMTAVIVTHKVVGPAYRLKKTFSEISSGKLSVELRLRRGDELQDVFLALEQMVEKLRARREAQLVSIEAALEAAQDDALRRRLIELRDQVRIEVVGQ